MTAAEPSARDVEVPASPLVADAPLSFPDLCARIHHRIAAFLDEQHTSDRLKSLQAQTRTSLDVIADALDKYQYACNARKVRCIPPRALSSWWRRQLTPARPGFPSSPSPTMAAKTASSC